VRTVLAGAVVVTCDEEHTVFDPGDVVLEDDTICYVGPSYQGEYDTRLYAGGKLVMPGLINAHTHSGMSILRSLSDDVDLMVFLRDRVWPREVKLTADDVYSGSLLSGIEMLRAGVTTYVDMYFFEDELARAAVDVGLRALITPTILDVPVWTPILGPLERQIHRGFDFCRRWEGRHGRIHTGLGPHSPYTVPLETLAELAHQAQEEHLPVNIHLVETKQERDSYDLGGRSIVATLEDVGFFDGPVIGAHSVWLTEGDCEIYARKRVGVAHCPQSNAKLGCGIAPVVEMLAHGIAVGLGTDSACTNNNLDLWEEMRLAPLLAKVSALDPKPLPATEALWMATRLGGKAVHLPDIGVLCEGFRADLVVLDLADTVAVPVFSPETYLAHLVYAFSARQVDAVWVNGSQVVRGGEVLTVDVEAARYAAQATALSLAKRVAG